MSKRAGGELTDPGAMDNDDEASEHDTIPYVDSDDPDSEALEGIHETKDNDFRELSEVWERNFQHLMATEEYDEYEGPGKNPNNWVRRVRFRSNPAKDDPWLSKQPGISVFVFVTLFLT